MLREKVCNTFKVDIKWLLSGFYSFQFSYTIHPFTLSRIIIVLLSFQLDQCLNRLNDFLI